MGPCHVCSGSLRLSKEGHDQCCEGNEQGENGRHRSDDSPRPSTGSLFKNPADSYSPNHQVRRFFFIEIVRLPFLPQSCITSLAFSPHGQTRGRLNRIVTVDRVTSCSGLTVREFPAYRRESCHTRR